MSVYIPLECLKFFKHELQTLIRIQNNRNSHTILVEIFKNCISLRKAVWPFLIVKMCKENIQKDLYKNVHRSFIFKRQEWKQTKSTSTREWLEICMYSESGIITQK